MQSVVEYSDGNADFSNDVLLFLCFIQPYNYPQQYIVTSFWTFYEGFGHFNNNTPVSLHVVFIGKSFYILLLEVRS